MGLLTLLVAVAAARVFAGGQPSRWAGWLLAGGTVMTVSAGLALSGLLARTDVKPPLLQGMLVLVLGALLGYGLSRRGRLAGRSVDLAMIVLLQSFRLPLEVLMLHAARRGVMPLEFSMAGYNFDVLTGALALPLGLALARGWKVPRALLLAWNLWGIGCLLVIVGLALATSPNVGWFGQQPQHLSLWVLRFPYVWLPVILVAVAVYAHLVISMQIWQRSAKPLTSTLSQPSTSPS